jgi:hypothetical protein
MFMGQCYPCMGFAGPVGVCKGWGLPWLIRGREWCMALRNASGGAGGLARLLA